LEQKLSSRDRIRLGEAVSRAKRTKALRDTTWALVTGAPGAGKTTVVHKLASLGFRTIEDPARALLAESEGANRSDVLAFQRRVLQRIQRTMFPISAQELVIFDYGLAECLAFLKVRDIAWTDDLIDAAASVRFGKAFVLETLPFNSRDADSVRIESLDERKRIDVLIRSIYEVLGQPLIEVPVAPVAVRLGLVLSNLERPSRKLSNLFLQDKID
jgi:predicted ATPase